ncbi:MAG: PD-(D/E)XK nuclease family protein [Clostridia bacterium]|nr:PD-(D/E)XK nuclease family protein [Clostridia bacterium]
MVKIKYSKNDIDRQSELISTIKTLSCEYKKVFVIVPEQLSLQREFSLGALFPETVSVLGFGRLCDEIFRTFGGGAKKNPDDAMVAAAVYKAVLSKQSELNYYKTIAGTSGFVTKLISVFSEFDTNRMTYKSVLSLPDSEASESLKSKYTDLFMLYDEYKKIWIDDYKSPGDDITRAAGMLELYDFFAESAVIFDGFYGFTPSQYEMISRILLQTDSVSFYFITDNTSDVFYTVDVEVKKILKECEKTDIPVLFEKCEGTKRYNGKSIAFLEKYAFSDIAPKEEFINDGSLTVYSAKNLSDELGYIACKIKNDVLNGKYRYSDIAILAPNPESVATVASAVFEKHGVPLFADVKRTLLSKPLMAFVLHAIDTVTYGFEFESVFAFLKTGLAGISFDDISVLENYVRMWKIRSGGWHKGEWTQSPSGLSPIENKEDPVLLERINSLRRSVYDPLMKFSEKLKSAYSCRDMLKAVYFLLEAFSVRDNLEDIANTFMDSGSLQLCDEYIRIYDIYIDMLDSIDRVFGTDKISVRRFCDLLTVCAGKTAVSHRPSRIDEVVLAGIGLVREENVKCVYVPCLTADVIPKPFSDTSLTTESEKRLFSKHGIPVSMDFGALSLRERFDVYIAMSTPTDELILSASEFTVTGEQKQRSDYLESITELTKTESLTREELDPSFFLVSVFAASELAAASDCPELSKAVYDITGFMPIAQQDDTKLLSDSIVNGMYSNHLRLSFSGVDEYVSCPFKFFVDKGLRVGKNETVEFRANDVGNFIHKGLERLLEGDYDLLTKEEQEIKEITDVISNDYYENELKDCKNRSKRFDYLFGRAKYAFEKAAVNVVSELKNSDFGPCDFEIDISKIVQPVPLGNGYSLALTGYIDRVDMADTENGKYFKIIDYKSGKQTFSLQKIYNGISMQLPIYAGAIRSKYTDAKLAAMYYLKVGVPHVKPSGKDGMDSESYNKSISSFYVRDGLFSDEEIVRNALDKSGEFLKKVKKTSITNGENLDKLVDYSMQKVKEIGAQIVSGNIAASPISGKDLDACSFCDYKDMCRIGEKESRKRELSELPEDFMKKDGDN